MSEGNVALTPGWWDRLSGNGDVIQFYGKKDTIDMVLSSSFGDSS